MIHLHTHSWFSFLDGASSPAALVQAAAACEQPALALTDTHSLAGAVQFARECREAGIKPIFGASIEVDGYPLTFLCIDRDGYANLCDLLTLAHLDRLRPHLHLNQLENHTEGLLCLTGGRDGYVVTGLRNKRYRAVHQLLTTLQHLFPEHLFVEATHHERPGDAALIKALEYTAREHRLPLVAANAVRYARPADFALHDALTCARLGLTVGEPHPLRPVNNRAYLRSAVTMQQLGFPKSALANTKVIADLCNVNLLPEGVTPPQALLPPGMTATEYLWRLCYEAVSVKYAPQDKARRSQALTTLRREIEVITELELPEFFLVVREVIQFARSRGIRCSGRGSAANSIVAYLLGITGVDPIEHRLLFERFLHTGRRGMPDIDVDFQSDRRDEVITWMSQRFGESHTAMTANVITFRLRLAVREMAKVLGYPLPLIDRLAGVLPSASVRHAQEHREEMATILGESRMLDTLLCLVETLHNCPRHLSLHSGGMILSRVPLRTLSPIQTSANGVRQIQFNKDDVESLGLIKFDILGLRMLSVVSETLELLRSEAATMVEQTTVAEKVNSEAAEVPDAVNVPDVDALPLDDEKAFQLIRSGQTMSLFQIESPGQWHLLSKSQPERFNDLIAQVALFRPGPLQSGMVHPYTLRRRGLQRVSYPHPSLIPVLQDTYGIVLYQEQVLEIAHAFAGLSLSEADEFRRLMSKFRDATEMEGMRSRFVEGAIAKHGVAPQVANHVFDVIAQFVGYGFCKSHAASFAQIVYQSAYLKAHHTAAYMAAVLQHHPGFYPINTILEEARHWGVPVLPVDVLRSDVKYSLDRDASGRRAIRVPLTQIKGLSEEEAASIVLERMTRPFRSVEDLYRRVALHKDIWTALARSGALNAFGERRKVLWQVGELARRLGPSGQAQRALDERAFPQEKPPRLSQLTVAQLTAWNFETQNLTTGPHPLALQRPHLQRLGATPIQALLHSEPGRRVWAGGVVIARQRPPTAKGMMFVILEDETGRLPTAITPPVYERYRRELREPGLLIEGTLEGSGPGQVGSYRSVLIRRLWPIGGCGR